ESRHTHAYEVSTDSGVRACGDWESCGSGVWWAGPAAAVRAGRAAAGGPMLGVSFRRPVRRGEVRPRWPSGRSEVRLQRPPRRAAGGRRTAPPALVMTELTSTPSESTSGLRRAPLQPKDGTDLEQGWENDMLHCQHCRILSPDIELAENVAKVINSQFADKVDMDMSEVQDEFSVVITKAFMGLKPNLMLKWLR
ncbi:unnamed protein product, partial [Urochloa humidicola]